MKILALGVLWIACSSASPQNQPTSPVAAQSGTVRRILRSEGPLFVRAEPNKSLTFTAKEIQREGSSLSLKGDVEIKVNGGLLQADEAHYNWDTSVIEARGNVRIAVLVPAN